MTATLDARALNRALLARQGLLERTDWGPAEAVERLVGVQAQTPHVPYLALWSRIRDFDPMALSALVERRALVRAGIMRGTIHLVTADDCLGLQPHLRRLYRQIFGSSFARGLGDADVEEVVAAGRELLRASPRTRAQIGAALAGRWPEAAPASLGQAVVHCLGLVQVPPRGLWRRSGQATWALAEDWLGAPEAPADLGGVVLRYLRAFGPATVADIRTWSRLTGLREVVDGIRDRLRSFRDERGRELLDAEDGLLPDPGTPAPPRLLGEFDNAVLSHEDRTRIVPAGRNPRGEWPTGTWVGSVLVDGFHRAIWKLAQGKGDGPATLTIERYEPEPADPPDTRDALAAEAERAAAFTAPDAPRHVVAFA